MVHRVTFAVDRLPGRPHVGDPRRWISVVDDPANSLRVIGCPLRATHQRVKIWRRTASCLCGLAMSSVFRIVASVDAARALPCRDVMCQFAHVFVPCGRHLTLVDSDRQVRVIYHFLFGRLDGTFRRVPVGFFGVVLRPSDSKVVLLIDSVSALRRFAPLVRRRDLNNQNTLICYGCRIFRFECCWELVVSCLEGSEMIFAVPNTSGPW